MNNRSIHWKWIVPFFVYRIFDGANLLAAEYVI